MFDGPNDFDPALERDLPIEADAGIIEESEGWSTVEYREFSKDWRDWINWDNV